MRKKTLLLMQLGILSAGLCRVLSAANIPQPRPIMESIRNADVIVVASIGNYVPDPLALNAPKVNVHSPDGLIASFELQAAGTYELHQTKLIKGKIPAQFSLHMPMISKYYYGRNSFGLEKGSLVLLLLKKGNAGQWSSVDSLLPLIPLSSKANVVPAGRAQEDMPKETDAIDVLLASIPDKELRPIISRLLEGVVDKRMIAVMRPYSSDADTMTQSCILRCLAENQDVTAIPKIAVLATQLEKRGLGSEATLALIRYKTPESVEYLNPLIVDGTDAVRLNAMQALTSIADNSSVPFLMKALDKDDRQHIVAYGAYAALHRIIKTLGPANTAAYFYAHKDVETQPLKQWWEWEQIKAKQASTQPTSRSQSPSP